MVRPPELPNELLVEIGFFASDWAVIEQHIRLHLISLYQVAGNNTRLRTPREFNKLRKAWFQECIRQLPLLHHKAIKAINDRLVGRSTARNYALHGAWLVEGHRRYKTIVLEDRDDGLHKNTLQCTYAELRGQTDLLRELRFDLVILLRELHGSEDATGS